MTGRHTTLDYAITYHRRGIAVVPVPYKSKNPNRRGWQRLTLTEDDLPGHFAGNTNIGILTGKPSGWLVDVDCDVPEARDAARYFLPFTSMCHGYDGNERSHFWYIAEGASTTKFEFQENAADPTTMTMLVELRSTGCQTVVPQSIHPSGKQYKWDELWDGTLPEPVNAKDLLACVGRLAASALLARHWPSKGSRDTAAMALAGMLVHGGWRPLDADEFVRQTACHAGDEEWNTTRCGKGSQAARKIHAGEHVTGAPTLAAKLRDGERVVTKVREWLGLGGQQTAQAPRMMPPRAAEDDGDEEGDDDLTLNTWPEPMGEAAYIGPIGDFVRKLAPQTEAAKEGLLVQALAAAGNAMGRHAYYAVEADQHHTNLFAVLVGGTGARKGVSQGHVRNFLRRADPDWEKDHIVNGLSTGEGLINVVKDDDPAILDRVALAFESEFASVFKVKGREGNTLSTVLRQAWDGDVLRTLTKNTPLRATGAHVSIIGHITPDELRRVMSETDAGNGFGNRILWVCVRRARYLPEGGEEVTANTEMARLRDAIQAAKTRGRLQRDDEAKALWREKYRSLSSGRPGLLGAVTNRAEAQVTRLSLIYALLDKSPVITKRHLEAALAVWEYCLASAAYIFGAALGDALAEKLDAELAKHGAEGMSRTDIYNLLGNNTSAKDIARALGLLASQGRAEMRSEKRASGRTTKRWYPLTYDVNNVNNGTSSETKPDVAVALIPSNTLNTSYVPVCIKCRTPKRILPDGGYELACTCGQKVQVPA